ncbi:MAG TPA: molybdenum cofactor biosynthesis protein MoaE [Candidatus Dormibacteraeota bacterium]|nr:molybdenum cofactor biosynthesis protein MoaE [Candidatus Dormibacteraeota bacterium]
MAESVVIVLGPEPLDAGALAQRVVGDLCGAVVTMVGVVRRLSDDGRSVTGMAYESYDSMALREMGEIAEEARSRWPECNIAIAHRVGSLAIGEASVVIAAASPHRAEAFDACEYCIDEVKARVEVWKQEHYADAAEPQWLENRPHPR